MVKESKKAELAAIIRLLDEPDDSIYQELRKTLLNHGFDAIHELLLAKYLSINPLISNRLDEIINSISLENTYQELSSWANFGGKNLLLGFMIVTKFKHPEIDQEKIKQEIEKIKKDVWLELNENLTALEKIKVMNHVFFTIYGFKPNKDDFHALSNSCIDSVLENKEGNPLSLGILYIIIMQELGLPVYGINLPEHFILTYAPLIPDEKDEEAHDVLFYINPFNFGAVFTKREIDLFLSQIKVPPHPSFYMPCTNIEIIRRLLRNIAVSFGKTGKPEKVKEIETLLKALD